MGGTAGLAHPRAGFQERDFATGQATVMDKLFAQGTARPPAGEKRLVTVEPFLTDCAVPGLNPQEHRLPSPAAFSNTHAVKYSEGARREARGQRHGIGWSAVALAQAQWTDLVNVPVGSTGFGLTLGSTASTNINQSEGTASTPAKTDGSTGFSQSGFENQRLFVNGNFIDELTFGSEQIATFISTSTDQFLTNRDMSASTDSHTIEPELNSSLSSEIQHETITKIVRQESFESEVSDNGAFVNGGSIVGIPNFDLGLQSALPGGNGSVSDLEFFDLQKLSLLLLQPGTNLIQVPELQRIEVLPIVDVTAPWVRARTNKIRTRFNIVSPSVASPYRQSRSRSNVLTFSVLFSWRTFPLLPLPPLPLGSAPVIDSTAPIERAPPLISASDYSWCALGERRINHGCRPLLV